MSKQDEYLKKAKDVQDWADRASTQMDRNGWTKVSRGWLDRIKPPQSETEQDENPGARCRTPFRKASSLVTNLVGPDRLQADESALSICVQIIRQNMPLRCANLQISAIAPRACLSSIGPESL